MRTAIFPLLAVMLGFTAQAKPAGAGTAKKILVVMSSENKITLKDGIVHPTGYFLSELGVPLKALFDAGYEPVFATPKGNPPVMDAVSDNEMWFGGDKARLDEMKAFVNRFTGLRHPYKLADLLNVDPSQFAGMFVPGGHAPMEDLVRDRNLGRLLRLFHQASKPTALICHGPIALLSARDSNGEWPYSGYRMTSFSTAEEKQEEPGEDNVLGGFVKFYPDQALSEAGGLVTVAPKWQANVVRDRELITGQNPFSDKELADALLQALGER